MAKKTKSYSKKTSEGSYNIIKNNDQVNKGAWTSEEDQKLAEVIRIHGAQKWKNISTIAGLNRCGKSCRLRWLNYLRPNIKRGNISDQEEDLILRLHKLLGNRWSLIAGRLPGRTDNEIKNYWNSHLSKKINYINHKNNKQKEIKKSSVSPIFISDQENDERSRLLSVHKVNSVDQLLGEEENNNNNNNIVSEGSSSSDFDVDDFFDFSDEGPLNMVWMSRFLDVD